jgi:hypothetical protein
MKKLLIATAAVFGLGIASPTHAASEIDCMVMWEKTDVYKNDMQAAMNSLELNWPTVFISYFLPLFLIASK